MGLSLRQWIIGSLSILFISMLLAGGSFAYHFYSVFANSDKLFAFRHRHFEHLYFHTDNWSYTQGDSLKIYASTSDPGDWHLSFFPFGGTDSIWESLPGKTRFQNIPDRVSIKGSQWKADFQLIIPDSIETGWHILKLRTKKRTDFQSIFVQPRPGKVQKRVAFIFSTNTWNAYNHWGGQSLYTRNHTERVSFRRPQPLSNPFLADDYANHQYFFQAANKDAYLAQFIDSIGYDMDAYSMSDLHSGEERLYDYDLILISTHSEYWSRQMMQHLNQLLDSGLSLVSLSGNTAAYILKIDMDQRTMSVDKSQKESQWNVEKTIPRPFGTEYEYYGFHTYSPYEVQIEDHWILEHTGLRKGDLFGMKSAVYDYTQNDASWWKSLLQLGHKGNPGMASGMEIDRIYSGTPENWITIAAGLNPRKIGSGEIYPDPVSDWLSGNGAHMGYYKHPGGGLVFSTGSIASVGAIPYDKAFRQILKNVVEKCLERPSPAD